MRFPILKEHEFAVLMANGETGIILNTTFEIHREDIENQNVYTVFENIQQAKEFVKKTSLANDKIEFIIYNLHQEVVEFIKAKSLS